MDMMPLCAFSSTFYESRIADDKTNHPRGIPDARVPSSYRLDPSRTRSVDVTRSCDMYCATSIQR